MVSTMRRNDWMDLGRSRCSQSVHEFAWICMMLRDESQDSMNSTCCKARNLDAQQAWHSLAGSQHLAVLAMFTSKSIHRNPRSSPSSGDWLTFLLFFVGFQSTSLQGIYGFYWFLLLTHPNLSVTCWSTLQRWHDPCWKQDVFSARIPTEQCFDEWLSIISIQSHSNKPWFLVMFVYETV